MFWSKNKKNRYTYPCIPQFHYMKVGLEGVCITRTCFPDVYTCMQHGGHLYTDNRTIHIFKKKKKKKHVKGCFVKSFHSTTHKTLSIPYTASKTTNKYVSISKLHILNCLEHLDRRMKSDRRLNKDTLNIL